MKKTGFLTLFAALLLAFFFSFSGVVAAQWDMPDKSTRAATPLTVATLYHIIQQKQPDVAAWARETEAYKNAQGFDKNVVLDAEMARLRNELRLISPLEPVVVNTLVRLSHYSDVTKGYLVDGLGAQTYFPYEFAGENYAIVLPQLVDYEWIGMEGKTHEDIESALRGTTRSMRLSIKLRVNYADNNSVILNNKPYKLLSGKILSLELYPRKGRTDIPLWWMDSREIGDEAQQELMLLKK